MRKYLLLIIQIFLFSAFGQNLKPESPLFFTYPVSQADLEKQISAKRYTLKTDEWNVLESNLKQQQTELATQLMGFDMQLMGLTHQLQVLENLADIGKIDSLLLQRKNTRAKILEMQGKTLQQIPLKGLYLVFMPVEDVYTDIDLFQKATEATILPEAIKTWNGTFIQSLVEIQDNQVLSDQMKEQVSGTMEMGNKLCGECESKRFDNGLNYYYKICEVNVYPLQKKGEIDSLEKGAPIQNIQLVDLVNESDYEKEIEEISSKTVKNKLLSLLKTYLPKHKQAITEFNKTALLLQKQMLLNLSQELQRIDEKIAASQKRKEMTIMQLDSIAKTLNLPFDPTQAQTFITKAKDALKQQHQAISAQKFALKNTELIYETVKVGGEHPNLDIAQGVFEHLPIWEERYAKLTDFQQEIAIKENVVEQFSTQSGLDMYRNLGKIWVYPVPVNSAIYVGVVCQFNMEEITPKPDSAAENVTALADLDTVATPKNIDLPSPKLALKDSLQQDSLLKSYVNYSKEFAEFLALRNKTSTVKLVENSPKENYDIHIETTSKPKPATEKEGATQEKQNALKNADEAFNKGLYAEAISIYRLYLNELSTNQIIKLARIYMEGGDGIQQNAQQAIQYFELAVQKGSDAANFYLGYFYFQGKDIELDDKKAFEYFEKASNGGILQASSYLGIMYEEGRGREKDMGQAIAYYTKSASSEPGDALGQYRLGKIYEEAKNKEQAQYWYRKSARNGYEKAKKQLMLMK
ncbi:MAG: tetratricopeptide repeat protein [Bacteroidia bacterium]